MWGRGGAGWCGEGEEQAGVGKGRSRLVWGRNDNSGSELVIYKTILRPILLLYRHESWVTNKILDSHIQAAHMKMSLIKSVTMRDKIRNADIYDEFHI